MVRQCVRLWAADLLQPLALLGVLAAGLVLAATACGEKQSPVWPTQTQAPSTPQVTATGLKIRGCAEAEGYQCRAFLAYSNGDETDVTPRTQWQSEDRLVANVDASTGQVAPRAVGTVTISGRHQAEGAPLVSGTQAIDILMPPIEINGTVWASDSKADVAGARLLVTEGPHAGMATTTNSAAGWRLTVLPTPALKLEVSHPDYRTSNFELTLVPVGTLGMRHLQLTPLRASPSPSPTPPAPPAPQPPPLPPTPSQITQDFTGQLEDSYVTTPNCPDPRYFGYSVPCRTFTLPPSPHRQIGADLVWRNEVGGIDSDIEVGFQIRQSTYVVVNSHFLTPGSASILYTQIEGNKAVEVRVLLFEGRGPAKFTLRTTRTSIY